MAIERTIRYTGKDVTVLWKPQLCMHSRRCFTGLPEVFDPMARPWVRIDGADAQRVIDQVAKCPSGALSIATANEETATTDAGASGPEDRPVINVTTNGPLLVEGTVTLQHPDGRMERKEGKCALCRCGHSRNKPFCDGSHRREGFVG